MPDPQPEPKRPSIAILERMLKAGWILQIANTKNEAVFSLSPQGVERLALLRGFFNELGDDLPSVEVAALYKVAISHTRDR
jgi:DNA-binding PadR family transcriptional regulator